MLILQKNITFNSIAVTWVILVTLGRDVTRLPARITRVLPLADAVRTVSIVNTFNDTFTTYHSTNMPGAVTVSVQIIVQIVLIPFTVAPFPEDCRPLLPVIVSVCVFF